MFVKPFLILCCLNRMILIFFFLFDVSLPSSLRGDGGYIVLSSDSVLSLPMACELTTLDRCR